MQERMNDTFYTRREILRRLSWAGLMAAGAAALGPLVRYLADDEDQPKSPLIFLKKEQEANVDTPWQNIPDSRVWVKRDQAGIMAMVATCTHLGCEVRYHADKKQWICPCHGSTYDEEGIPVSGPAQKPLPRVAVERKGDGSLVIYTNKEVGRDERA